MKALKNSVERILNKQQQQKNQTKNLPKNSLSRFQLRSIANPSCVVSDGAALPAWIW